MPQEPNQAALLARKSALLNYGVAQSFRNLQELRVGRSDVWRLNKTRSVFVSTRPRRSIEMSEFVLPENSPSGRWRTAARRRLAAFKHPPGPYATAIIESHSEKIREVADTHPDDECIQGRAVCPKHYVLSSTVHIARSVNRAVSSRVSIFHQYPIAADKTVNIKS